MELPPEIWELIFSFLSTKDLAAIERVSAAFRASADQCWFWLAKRKADKMGYKLVRWPENRRDRRTLVASMEISSCGILPLRRGLADRRYALALLGDRWSRLIYQLFLMFCRAANEDNSIAEDVRCLLDPIVGQHLAHHLSGLIGVVRLIDRTAEIPWLTRMAPCFLAMAKVIEAINSWAEPKVRLISDCCEVA